MEVTVLQKNSKYTFLNEFQDELFSRKTFFFYAYFFFCLILFFVYKKLLIEIATPDKGLLCLSIVAVISLMGIGIKTNSIPQVLRILLRLLFGFFGVYILIAFPTFSTQELLPHQTFLLGYGRYLIAFISFAACFFPVLGLLPLTYIVWYKSILTAELGLYISSTDYLPLIEIGIFLILCILVHHALCFSHRCRALLQSDEAKPNKLCSLEKIFSIGPLIMILEILF